MAPPPFAPSLTSRLPQLETLFKAAFLGQLRLLKKAVRKLDKEEGEGHVGAVRDSSGLSVLHLAALGGTKPVCKYLVEELQLDVDTIDPRGGTPLTTAICLGHLDVVSYLLDHGADTEKLNDDGDGFPALQLAAREGKCEMVELLLSKGAYIDATTKGGTALHAAARAGRDDVVKILLDHHADHKIALGGFTPLVVAIYACSPKCVKLLLEAGADVNVTGIGKETLLMVAATAGLTDILKCLVLAGADPNDRDSFGCTPIEIAACCSRREHVEILFPVTNRIPSVCDWSVDGMISYTKSVLPAKEAMLASEKFEGHEAFTNTDYLVAAKIYTELHGDLLTWTSVEDICKDGKILKEGERCENPKDPDEVVPSEHAIFLEMLVFEDRRKDIDVVDFYKLEPPEIPPLSLHYLVSRTKTTKNGYWKNRRDRKQFVITTAGGYKGTMIVYDYYKGRKKKGFEGVKTEYQMILYRIINPDSAKSKNDLVLHSFRHKPEFKEPSSQSERETTLEIHLAPQKLKEAREHAKFLEDKIAEDRKIHEELVAELHEAKKRQKILENEIKEGKKREKLLEGEIKGGDQIRKMLLNELIELKGKIRVFCRVKLSTEEGCVFCPKSRQNIGRGVNLMIDNHLHPFIFDRVFPHSASQEDVFMEISQLVQSALDGYKVCIFAYGQSGSGKTYTMMGPPGKLDGIIPKSVEQIFQSSQSLLISQGWKYKLQVSMLEIYNGVIHDFLGDKHVGVPKQKITCVANGLPDIHVVDVHTMDEVFPLLEKAAKIRRVKSTTMNDNSTRSHFIFRLQILSVNEEGTAQHEQGVLNLIDLAGSERMDRGADGDTQNETKAINSSLFYLRLVLSKIAKKEKGIPWGSSTLTSLLRPCIEGESKTLLLVNISPDVKDIQYSLPSLQFANDVKNPGTKLLRSPLNPKAGINGVNSLKSPPLHPSSSSRVPRGSELKSLRSPTSRLPFSSRLHGGCSTAAARPPKK